MGRRHKWRLECQTSSQGHATNKCSVCGRVRETELSLSLSGGGFKHTVRYYGPVAEGKSDSGYYRSKQAGSCESKSS